ncbi:LuxR family transcriptional regulator [Candidatus Liberibacter solanacearum]|uniref:Putative GerE/LuxR family transcriptional regulator n=1 Tax=Candidatus Liberibacter solanacearum TaxID=556287 RepID=A0A094ZZP9_9HYPH|nr:helix-turn-helix transcriptional regulator [Candidatus Liberibacter solanacearum]KGB27356.1 LuxR family transcriptional regulator [Candidatus Liberibacter solanacearum]KJZ80886.1 LuxR family transcriptional regulator [Candidatus Liberibacter solanacearum]KJZ82030.1 putative GerE/LuxR family transcriptional regulator [Candidatus Liberibacter solanacearum]KQC49545.1 LuxR family transcriptional regulator [Candidatus Liberibacter solanacearum]
MNFEMQQVNIVLNREDEQRTSIVSHLPTRSDLLARMIPLDRTVSWKMRMYALTEYVGASHFLLVRWDLFQEQKLDSVVSSDWPFDLVRCMTLSEKDKYYNVLQRPAELFCPVFHILPENVDLPSGMDNRYCALTFDVGRIRIGLMLLFPKGRIVSQDRLWEIGLLAAYQANMFKNYNVHLGKDFELTGREIECLTWISEGKTSDEIAVILGISRNTINNYIASIMRKTATKTRSGAIAYAVRNNIV